MKLSRPDFDFIRQFARERTAIVIDEDRDHFVESRIGPVAVREGFGSISVLCNELRTHQGLTALHLKVIDAITTNETLFFRDVHPFEALRTDLLPQLARSRSDLKIWSAACSTGQEPYSVAMILREHFAALSVSLDATDLVTRVLDYARAGSYSQLEVRRGLPPTLLARYFKPEENRWQIRDDLRSAVRFSQMNLIEPWPKLPQYDIILLRNVLIYFDIPTKKAILEKVATQLQPDGFLIMGSAETPIALCPLFKAHRCGPAVVYQKL